MLTGRSLVNWLVVIVPVSIVNFAVLVRLAGLSTTVAVGFILLGATAHYASEARVQRNRAIREDRARDRWRESQG